MTRLPDKRITEIEEAEIAATPGPWEASDEYVLQVSNRRTVGLCHGENENEDAEFVAMSRTAIYELLTERRELVEKVERLEEEADKEHAKAVKVANKLRVERTRAEKAEALETWCPNCGEDVALDEDLCCASCGNEAVVDIDRVQHEHGLRENAEADLAEARAVIERAINLMCKEKCSRNCCSYKARALLTPAPATENKSTEDNRCVFCDQLIGTNISAEKRPLMCGGCAASRLKRKSFE